MSDVAGFGFFAVGLITVLVGAAAMAMSASYSLIGLGRGFDSLLDGVGAFGGAYAVMAGIGGLFLIIGIALMRTYWMGVD